MTTNIETKTSGKDDGADENTLDTDVTPADLLNLQETSLGPILREVDRQWPQGRDRLGNGHGSRIGTIEVYFDGDMVLHMHFRERGMYLRREGALAEVPLGNMSGYNINPVFNVADTAAGKVGDMLVSLPKGTDPNDPRWDRIFEMLSEMGAVSDE